MSILPPYEFYDTERFNVFMIIKLEMHLALYGVNPTLSILRDCTKKTMENNNKIIKKQLKLNL